MKIYVLVEREPGMDAMIVATYLREELALAARDKLGFSSHDVEEHEVMDA